MQAVIAKLDKNKVYKPLLLLVILLYLFLSINFILEYGSTTFKELQGDAMHYEIMVKQLLQKGIYGYKSEVPTAYVTPGYPLFLSFNYWIFGYADKPGGPHVEIRIIQAIIGAFTLFYVFLIGRRISGNGTGVLGAFLLSIYPAFIKAPTYLLTEMLATFFLVAYVYYQLTALENKSLVYSIISGILIGLSVLTRPGSFVILSIPFIYSYFAGNRDRLLKLFIFTLTGFMLIMTPWMARNIIVIGEAAPFSKHGGDALLAGVDPYYYELGPEYRYHGPTYKKVVTEELGDKLDCGLDAIREGFKREPLLYLEWFTIGKFNRMFGSLWVSPEGYLATLHPIHYVIVVLGWAGALISLRARSIRIVSLAVIAATAFLLLVVPEPRFVFSLMPLLSVNAAELLVRSWRG